MLNKLLFSLLLSSIIALPSFGQIYQSKDADGNPVFTDQPSPGAKPIEIQETNSAGSITPMPAPKKIKPQQPDQIYSSFSITNPRNGHHFANGLVAFNVNMSISPSLQQGHTIELMINGSVQSKGRSLTRQVESIERGEHSLSARVIDRKGKTIITSKPVKVSAQRPSQLINNNSGPVNLPSRPSIR